MKRGLPLTPLQEQAIRWCVTHGSTEHFPTLTRNGRCDFVASEARVVTPCRMVEATVTWKDPT